MSEEEKPSAPGALRHPYAAWNRTTSLPQAEKEYKFGAKVRETVYRLARADAALRGEQIEAWIEDAMIEKLRKRGILES